MYPHENKIMSLPGIQAIILPIFIEIRPVSACLNHRQTDKQIDTTTYV